VGNLIVNVAGKIATRKWQPTVTFHSRRGSPTKAVSRSNGYWRRFSTTNARFGRVYIGKVKVKK
jgi:hypothetical protein